MRDLASMSKKGSKKPVREDEIIRYAQQLQGYGLSNEQIDKSLDKKFGKTWQGYRELEKLRGKVSKAKPKEKVKPKGPPKGLPPGREPAPELPAKKAVEPPIEAPVQPKVSPIEASLVPQEKGYAPSGTPPGDVVSELTPNPWLPAFTPNYQAIYNPWLSMISQPSYTDPSWYLRAESPYPSGMQYTQSTFQPYQPQSYGMSGFYQQPFGMGLGYSASNPYMSGNTFNQYSPNSPIGGGMLGNAAKGLSPVAIGGMLGRNYYS